MTLLLLQKYLRENTKLFRVVFFNMEKLFYFCLLLLQIINDSEQDNLGIKSLICQSPQKQRFACSLSTLVSSTPRDDLAVSSQAILTLSF